MRQVQKLCSILLIAALLLGCAASVLASDSYTQAEIADFEKNKQLFQILGVLDMDADMQISDTISRGSFAQLMVKLLGYQGSASAGGVPIYSDVPPEHANFGAISIAAAVGMMNGYGGGMFGPDDALTTEQAIIAFVNAAGYRLLSNQYGGGATGCLIAGQEIGLLSGLEISLGYPITMGALLRMVVNTLGVPFMTATQYGDGRVEYTIDDGDNAIVKYLGIRRKTGIVTATQYTDLLKPVSLPENMVRIDGDVYSADQSYTHLLGYMVEYFVTADGSNEKIILMTPLQSANEVLEIDAQDIVSYSGRQYTYFDGKRQKKENIPSDCSIIYNGRAIAAPAAAQMHMKSGGLTMIDNDKDGVYDVLLLRDYQQIVVHMTDAEQRLIFDKYDASKTLELDDHNDTVILRDSSGNPVEFEDIKQWNVLQIARSDDAGVIEVIVSSASLRGVVQSVEHEADIVSTVEIGGVRYETSPLGFHGEISPGDSGLFLFDAQGDIAVFMASGGNGMRVGCLLNAKPQGGLDSQLAVKLLDDTGAVVTLTSRMELTVDGQNKLTPAEVMEWLAVEDGQIVPQVVQYRLDQDGLLRELDTAVAAGQPPESETDLRVLHAVQPLPYRAAQQTFDGKVNVSAATLIFMVPVDAAGAADEDFQVVSNTYFEDNISYTVETYSNSTNQLTADIALLRNTPTDLKSAYGAVSSIRTVLDEATGETRVKLLVQRHNGVATVYADDGFEHDLLTGGQTLGEGDFIQYSANAVDKLVKLTLLYDASEGAMLAANPNGAAYITPYRVAFGGISHKEGNVIAFTTGDPASAEEGAATEQYLTTAFQCYRYDTTARNPALVGIGANQLVDYQRSAEGYSKILIFTYYNEGRMIVEYK